MGAGEESTPSKPTTSTQETPSTPSYPDWSTPLQAYYGAGATPPFFTSTVGSHTPHPYMWGSQHPLVPPYGTPLYPALYPHAGIYAHSNMAVAQSAAPTNRETEGKVSDGKDKASSKKSKGSSGNMGLIDGKSGESGKAGSGSGNDDLSQSAESGSEGSSDASDENANQQDFSVTKKRSFDQMLADGANVQNNNSAQFTDAKLPVLVRGKPVVPMSATNLNVGMDFWNTPPAGTIVSMKSRRNASGVSPAGTPVTMDDHELRKQKRKQSNRESARRSRLRKQAECEELQTTVEALKSENHSLSKELHRISEDCEKLTSENKLITEQLTGLYGPNAVSDLESDYPSPVLESINVEGNSSHEEDTSRGGNSSISGQKSGNGNVDSVSN